MQIWKVNNYKWRHYQKTIAKIGPPRNQLNYISFERYWREVSKNVFFFLNASHYVKSYGHFCQILAFLTMPAHQIWSNMVKEANFKKFSLRPSSAFNIRKSHKISSRKALSFKSYQPKTSLGGGGVKNATPPPSTAFRVNSRNEKSLHRKWQSATNVHIIPDEFSV